MLKPLLLVAFALSVASAQAVTFADDFGVASPAVSLGSGWAQGADVVLGGGVARALTAAVESNPAPKTARAWSVVGGGAYTFGSDPGVDGWGQIDYRLGSMDLRGVTSFRIDLLASAKGGTLGIVLGDANTDTMLRPVAIPASASPSFLTIKVPDGLADDLDLAHATNLGLWIDTGVGGSVRIDAIRAVPEPASLAALAVGAVGLRRRKARR